MSEINLDLNSWIDVHTHINMLEPEPEEIIRAAAQNKISRLVTVGTGADDHPKIMELVTSYAPTVLGTLGYHPHDAKDFGEEGEKFMRENLPHERIIAVGEIGLDYYYEHSVRDIQVKAFHRQMELAQEFKLPVEIHSRDAERETIDVLKRFAGQVKGLMHCFTGTQWLADEALALGYNISISGVVTFKNAEALREVVKSVPLDRIHIETDAPFLTPVPFRGKKNEPALMVHTAEVVASLKGVSLGELAAATTANARRLFAKLH